MKKLLLMVMALMLVASSAFAANFGVIKVMAEIADTTSLDINGLAGDTDGIVQSIIPTFASGTGAKIVSNVKTNLVVKTNFSSYDLWVVNASHTSSTVNVAASGNYRVDGMVNYARPMSYYGPTANQVPIFVSTANVAPALDSPAWKEVRDAQYWTWYDLSIIPGGAVETAPLWRVNYNSTVGRYQDVGIWANNLTGTQRLMPENVRHVVSGTTTLLGTTYGIWYQVNFTGTTPPGVYSAVLQYGLTTQ